MSLFNIFRKNKTQKNDASTNNNLKSFSASQTVVSEPVNIAKSKPVVEKSVTNNIVNKPIRRNYFYVYQNKTYHEERSCGFLWSPKYASGNRKNAGYETMKDVSSGDVIFHSFQGNIVAISVAKDSCYSFARPGASFSEWYKDGWRIDTEYFTLSRPFLVSPHIPYLYSIQPENGPYTAAHRGKQQYLCDVSLDMFGYLMERIYKSLSPIEADRLASFLGGTYTPTPASAPNPIKSKAAEPVVEKKAVEIESVEDGCTLYATIQQTGKPAKFIIDLAKFPQQKVIIGKTKGDIFVLPNVKNIYIIDKILN